MKTRPRHNASRRRFLGATAAAGAAAFLRPARRRRTEDHEDAGVGAADDGRKAVSADVSGDVSRSRCFSAWRSGLSISPRASRLCCRPRQHRRLRAACLPTQGRGAVGGGTERDEPPDYPWEPSGGRPHPGYDVLVLNDQMDWPEATRELARQAVEAGQGFVLLHHSLGDNQDWPWWYQEVTGGLLVLSDRERHEAVDGGERPQVWTCVRRVSIRSFGNASRSR